MTLKTWLHSACPPLYKGLMWLYQQTPIYATGLKKALEDRKTREAVFLKELFGDELKIISGPFQGIQYIDEASGSVLLPKLLGTYETALQPWIIEIIKEGYDTLIDVGCAEGYYAVGLARALPNVKVLAYDLNPKARNLCQNLAEANRVADRIKIRQECSEEEIGRNAQGKTIIICDIEGGEFTLLDPEKIPVLKRCDLIVEAHDFLNPDITPELKRRFQPTHKIETVTTPAFMEIAKKNIDHLSKEDQEFILDEQRAPGQVWHRFRAISQ